MLATRQLLVLYIISNLCSCQHAGADGADLVQIRLQHDRGTNPTKCDGVTIAPCTQTDGKWFMPLNMAGQGRTVASPAGCQKRCEDTTGCKAFNNFPNGGCHMSTAAAGTKSGGGNPTIKSGLVGPKVTLTWYTKPSGTSTYKSDTSFCANKGAGGRLATYAEYCPGGEGADVYEGKKTKDQWAAFSGAGGNEWVQVGTRANSLCKKHTPSYGQPAWGTDTDKRSYETYTLCALPEVVRAVLRPGKFTAISSTSSRGDEARAIDGDPTTYSWMTKSYTTDTPQTITARVCKWCAKLGGVSWSTGPITTRGTATDDLSVLFLMAGIPVSAVVDESNPKVLGTFTSSPDSSGWHLTAVAVEGKSHSFTWPLEKTAELKLVFKVSGFVHWPIYEISPRCSA